MRVLLIDDAPDVALVVSALLRHAGHAVWVAHCGAEALAIAAEVRPEAVLLDLRLPDMDGCDLARQLQSPGRRIIALTGWAVPSDRAAAVGIHAQLIKPVGLDQLRAALGG